jgi:hypothetical protein
MFLLGNLQEGLLPWFAMLSSYKLMANQILYSSKYGKIFHKAQCENLRNSSKQQQAKQARVVSKKYRARLNESR